MFHISAQELNYLYPAQGTTLGDRRASSPTQDKELNLLIHSLNPVPPALRAGSARCRISTLSEIPAKIIAVWNSLACQGTPWWQWGASSFAAWKGELLYEQITHISRESLN